MVMSSIEARSFGCYSYRYTYFNKGCFGNHALVFENYCLVVTQAKHCIVFCVLMTKSQSNLYWNRCMPICSVLNNVIIYCKASLVKQVQRKQVQHVVFTYFHIDHNAPYLPPHQPHFPEFCITIVSKFSWVLQSSQEKSGWTRCIMVFVKMVNSMKCTHLWVGEEHRLESNKLG